jgi:hypothetical protein
MSNQQTSSSKPSAPRGIAPALTLMVLAPMVAEVLSGATRLSYIFVLVPEILVWGGGALIIRELVRRWGGGWFSMLLMGLCLSIAEETIIQQTSLAPLPWLGNHPVYGRVWGVNWVYFLFMLGYESVWVVLAPVQLTELLFPERGKEPWLRRKGLVTVSVLFLVGSYIAWFAWTQRARPITFHAAQYTPPLLAVGLGALAIVVLTTMAYLSRTVAVKEHATRKTSPWLVGLGTLPLGLAWYELMALVFAPRMGLPLWIPMAGGIAWAALAFFIIRHWSSSANWGDLHRWALVSSTIVVCMAAGFSGSEGWPRIDMIGKIVMNIIAAVLLLLLGRNILHRSRTSAPLERIQNR